MHKISVLLFIIAGAAIPAALFLAPVPVRAHTFMQVEAECPVCGNKFKVNQTASMTTFGAYKDFQKQGAIGSYYQDMIISCPKCHFAGYNSDFEKKVDDKIKEKVLKELKPINPGKQLDQATECEFAARIYQWKGEQINKIGFIYLVGSYLLKGATDEKDIARRRDFQKKSADCLEKALDKGEITGKSRASISYLIGELKRRTGDFESAVKWYDRAINDKEKPEWLDKLAQEQKQLAENKDDNNDI